MTGNLDGILVQSLTGCLGYRPGRRELDDLLVAALERAVALAEVDDVAVLVAQHLYFDVLGLNQVLLDEDILIAERLLGLALDAFERGSDLFRGITAPHTATAAATGCLEDDRETERDCLFERFVCVAQRLGGTGNGGDAAGLCNGLGRQLVAHLREDVRRRADEGDTGFLAGAGEISVFAQKAVAGMDGIDIVMLGQINDGRDVQIGLERTFVFTNEIGFIGAGTEETVGIFVGIDCDSVQSKIVTGAKDADCNFAPVGNQNFTE